MTDNCEATGQLETEIARYLFDHRNGAWVHEHELKQHLTLNHAKILGDSVLEVEELVSNLRKRKVIDVKFYDSGHHDGSSRMICKWRASELDAVVFFTGR